MAQNYTLDVQSRHITGKQVEQLRRAKLVPAVIYGAGGQAVNVSCPYRSLELVLLKAGGSHLITLTLDGREESVLVREVQRHPIRREIQHVDFLRVDLTKRIRTEARLILINPAKLAIELSLSTYMTQIEIECLPANIPDHLEVDISGLKAIGDQITVASLPVSDLLTIITDPTDVIARVELASSGGAEGDAGETPVTAEPEISVAKGKKDDDA